MINTKNRRSPALEFDADVERSFGRNDDGVTARQHEVSRIATGHHRVVRQRLAARVLQAHLQADSLSLEQLT